MEWNGKERKESSHDTHVSCSYLGLVLKKTIYCREREAYRLLKSAWHNMGGDS
jgi:hypothetical protein